MSEEFITVQRPDDDGPVSMNVRDLFNPRIPRTDRETRDGRMAICQECPLLFVGEMCKVCHCLMRGKTWLKDAQCALPEPDRKW